MTDRIDPIRRSANMARIRSSGTQPEIAVRRAVHAAGLRFRLNRRDLPGTPDLVLPKCRIAVFVHGCFWHRHEGCKNSTTPKSRVEFWKAKFEENLRRDQRVSDELSHVGWAHFVVWECETKQKIRLSSRILELWQLCHARAKSSISSD